MTATPYTIDRSELERVFNRRAARQFEEMQDTIQQQGEVLGAGVGATEALADATFITLSPNAELPNEYVLQVGPGLSFDVDNTAKTVTIVTSAPSVSGGFGLSFVVSGPSEVVVPLLGVLTTRTAEETLSNKTLSAPKLSSLINAVDDAAASAAGVPVGGVYHNAGALRVRLT